MKTRAVASALLALLFVIFAISIPASTRASAVVDAASRRCAGQASSGAITHRAGLVVTFGDRHTSTFCIEFAEDSITGMQLLQRSGLPLVTSGTGGLGSAVCSIGGEGNSDPTNCFASCSGGSCAYWAYYRFAGGAWQFSPVGASQTTVHDGDIQGWAWGPGGTSTGAVPEIPGEICPPIASTPTSTWTPVPAVPSTTPPGLTAQPAPQPSIATTDPPAVVASASTTPDASSHPFATGVPAGGEPQAPAAPASSPQSAVEGEARSPARATSTPAAATPVGPDATPRSGAVRIGEAQGSQNEAHSESQASTGGGTWTSLAMFAIVAALLAAAAAAIAYRRRRAV